MRAAGIDVDLEGQRRRTSARPSRPSGHHPILALWHGRILAATRLFSAPRHRRHHQRELRRRMDRAHHGEVRLRRGARIDVARRNEGAAAAGSRCEVARAWHSRSMVRAARRKSRSQERCGWRKPPAIRCCRFTARPPRAGRSTAGIARRSRSRSRPWRSRSPNRSMCRGMRTTRRSKNGASKLQQLAGRMQAAVHGTPMPLVLVSSKRFVDHVTPAGHPERPERAQALARGRRVIQGAGRRGGRTSIGDR